MARWCVLLLLLAVLGAQADETTTETSSTEGVTPTRMPSPGASSTVPQLIHEVVGSSAAAAANATAAPPNATEKTQGKNAAAGGMGGRLAVVAVVGAWLTLSAI